MSGLSRKWRVLLVDDHQMVREGLRVMLEVDGRVTVAAEAGSGDEALAEVRECRPDIVLLDYDLDGRTSLELISPIRKLHHPVRIILLTADQRSTTLQQALQAGVDGYQLKNASIRQLVAAMAEVMAGRLVLPPALSSAIDPAEDPAAGSPGSEATATSIEPVALTRREQEVLSQLLVGASNREIAVALHISENTAKSHIKNIMAKFGVNKRMQLLRAVAGAQQLISRFSQNSRVR